MVAHDSNHREDQTGPKILATQRGAILTNIEDTLKIASPLGQLITIKLEDAIYLLCKFQVENAIIGYGLEGYIYGTQHIPPKTMVDLIGVVRNSPAFISNMR